MVPGGAVGRRLLLRGMARVCVSSLMGFILLGESLRVITFHRFYVRLIVFVKIWERVVLLDFGH